MSVSEIRALFSPSTKVGLAIGGWGDTAGFSAGAVSNDSRKLFAKNVNTLLDQQGYDFIGKSI